jgi:hypothetical protein
MLRCDETLWMEPAELEVSLFGRGLQGGTEDAEFPSMRLTVQGLEGLI